ncbi:potassium channel family protein [Segniliparus rotundus]|uniref:potassium channel family protein n=1 Tax=Segniliparus rotundus TaxID=286802 RepID=UPI0002E81884|nr:potassium channel family protein [Segniliparus rotundus]
MTAGQVAAPFSPRLLVPDRQVSPLRAITGRLLVAVLLLVVAAFVVYADRAGYRDIVDRRLTLLDCFYYVTVSLTTTGYGDITPVTEGARLVNILVITPMRVLFLIILVGTTLQVLAERSRQAIRVQRWRHKVRDHNIVVGYGTKGRSAVAAMLADGVEPNRIVVVDVDPALLSAASELGLVTLKGNAARSDVLRSAGAERSSSIVVAVNRDDTAVLVTLTARELTSSAQVVVAVRETENVHLLRRSGATSVVVSSETAGRLLGIATSAPSVVEVIEDLLTPEAGFAVSERDVEQPEVGADPKHLADIVLGVVRGGELIRVGDERVDALELGDRILYVHTVSKE